MQWTFLLFFPSLFILFESIHGDDLFDLNERFRLTYDRSRNHLISLIDPLIICHGDNATIIFRGRRYEEQITPKLYHDLKSISHIPFTIYLNVMFENGNITKENHRELKQYLRDIRSLRNRIEFPSDMQQNQYDIIDLSIEYLRTILKTKFIDQRKFKKFCQQARILFSININLAARAQLDMLDSRLRPWYQERFNNSERHSLKIVVMGPKTARYGFVIKTYLYALLGERHEGKHIIYVESVDDERKALEVLGTWLLDAQASQTFFNGDSERLHRDLLADAANVHIKQLFPQFSTDL